jgi:hypothetical protein
MMLAQYLSWLPTYDETAVTKLLHPDDPQDVPRAVELMLTVIEFTKTQNSLISDSFSIDVDTRADLASIGLLSALLQSILIPFINVELSLTQQFDHLSRYAHLAFAFFHAHRRSFMSYQLYYDTQTMVKNAFFCLAKQQSLDLCAPFCLGDVRDNPLEILFGRTHMIGGHNSACSYAQALNCLGAAKDIDGVFKCHPELDPGHHRLKLTHQEGVDHINREIWKGDIISGRCDLPLAWRKGHDDALSILITSQLGPDHYSFTDIFSTREVDILRPFGQNKYLGISTDDEFEDNSRVPEDPLPIPVPPPIQSLETVVIIRGGRVTKVRMTKRSCSPSRKRLSTNPHATRPPHHPMFTFLLIHSPLPYQLGLGFVLRTICCIMVVGYISRQFAAWLSIKTSY